MEDQNIGDNILNAYCMMVVSKYLDKKEDYVVLVKTCKKYRGIIEQYKYNPIEINDKNEIDNIFKNIEEFHIYKTPLIKYDYSDINKPESKWIQIIREMPTTVKKVVVWSERYVTGRGSTNMPPAEDEEGSIYSENVGISHENYTNLRARTLHFHDIVDIPEDPPETVEVENREEEPEENLERENLEENNGEGDNNEEDNDEDEWDEDDEDEEWEETDYDDDDYEDPELEELDNLKYYHTYDLNNKLFRICDSPEDIQSEFLELVKKRGSAIIKEYGNLEKEVEDYYIENKEVFRKRMPINEKYRRVARKFKKDIDPKKHEFYDEYFLGRYRLEEEEVDLPRNIPIEYRNTRILHLFRIFFNTSHVNRDYWLNNPEFQGQVIRFNPDVQNLEHGFFGMDITGIELPYLMTSMSSCMFSHCNYLSYVKLPICLKEIPSFCFEDCINLAHIDIPNSVTGICNRAFEKCISLSALDLPNGLKEIGSYAFFECTSLSRLVIPRSVTVLGKDAIRGCIKLWQPESQFFNNSIFRLTMDTFQRNPNGTLTKVRTIYK